MDLTNYVRLKLLETELDRIIAEKVRVISIEDYKHNLLIYNAMKKAGYIETEYFVSEYGSTYNISKFKDGTIIDSRKVNSLDMFHKKVYNE